MRHLLDTNVCVDYLTGRYPKVIARIQRSSPGQMCVSSVVVADLRYGADHSARRRTNHGRIDALGTPIGPNDMLIAAHALSRELTVVTNNVAEFGRVKGLKVENWR